MESKSAEAKLIIADEAFARSRRNQITPDAMHSSPIPMYIYAERQIDDEKNDLYVSIRVTYLNINRRVFFYLFISQFESKRARL